MRGSLLHLKALLRLPVSSMTYPSEVSNSKLQAGALQTQAKLKFQLKDHMLLEDLELFIFDTLRSSLDMTRIEEW